MSAMTALPVLPEDPRGHRLPPQGTWVRTEGGGEGRYVGRTQSGLYWVWYPRMAERPHPVSFEKMCARFAEKAADERVRVSLSASASETVADVLSCWSEADQALVTLRATYVEGPRHLIESLGMRIESSAWDDGDVAIAGVDSDNEVHQEFARNATVVAKLCLGRKLQGLKPHRRLVWKEVLKEGR